jgi:DNA-directed RNA polymerase specialized sigma subunit
MNLGPLRKNFPYFASHPPKLPLGTLLDQHQGPSPWPISPARLYLPPQTHAIMHTRDKPTDQEIIQARDARDTAKAAHQAAEAMPAALSDPLELTRLNDELKKTGNKLAQLIKPFIYMKRGQEVFYDEVWRHLYENVLPKFDPALGDFQKLASTACWRKVKDLQEKNAIPGVQFARLQQLREAADDFFHETGLTPTLDDLSLATGLTKKQIQTAQAAQSLRGGGAYSLDDGLEDLVPAPEAEDPLREEDLAFLGTQLPLAIATLSAEQQQIISLYFGGMTNVSEIERQTGITDTHGKLKRAQKHIESFLKAALAQHEAIHSLPPPPPAPSVWPRADA